jgi:hypothetical protein
MHVDNRSHTFFCNISLTKHHHHQAVEGIYINVYINVECILMSVHVHIDMYLNV